MLQELRMKANIKSRNYSVRGRRWIRCGLRLLPCIKVWEERIEEDPYPKLLGSKTCDENLSNDVFYLDTSYGENRHPKWIATATATTTKPVFDWKLTCGSSGRDTSSATIIHARLKVGLFDLCDSKEWDRKLHLEVICCCTWKQTGNLFHTQASPFAQHCGRLPIKFAESIQNSD